MDLKELFNERQKKERKKRMVDLGTMVYGKIPPQANQVEEAILGAIMLERGAFDRISELLTSEAFYLDAHQRIFKAMQSLAGKNREIDIMTLVEELRKMDELEMVGGEYYVVKLTNSVVSSANIEQHAHIVLEKFLQREMIRICGETIQSSYEDSTDVFQLMDEFEAEYTAILSKRESGKKIVGIEKHLVDRIQRIEKLRQDPKHITGIPSGFRDLDNITHGWQNTDLIILAARPAVGKTAFALNIARNAVMNNIKSVPVALFSLEMSTGQLVDRILASESEIWLEKIMNGQMTDDNMKQLYTQAIQPIAKSPKIFIDDTPALNIFQLRSKCRTLKRLWKKLYNTEEGLIIIDYLQLMSGISEGRSGNREQEISRISRGLKALAKELAFPVIALSQLSREPEKRKGEQRTPVLSDLRESGAIEQDADMVMFMYRPEYYDVTQNEMGESTRGLTQISISKHRNGKLAAGREAINLRAELAIQKFYDVEMGTQFPGAITTSGNWRPVREDERADIFLSRPGPITNEKDEDNPF
jgi:replicative DNA helicase